MDQIVNESVTAWNQPEQVGRNETEQPDQQVDRAHHTHGAAGDPLVPLSEANVGQDATSEQVDYILLNVYVEQPTQQSVPKYKPPLPRARGALSPLSGQTPVLPLSPFCL